MEKGDAPLKAEIAALKKQVEFLMAQLNTGLSLDKLYTKEAFLAAVRRENKYWKDLMKDPAFKHGVLLGSNQTPMLRGEDYYRFLLKRRGRDETGSSSDSEA